MPTSRWSVVRLGLLLSAMIAMPTLAQSDKPSPNDNRDLPARQQLITMQFSGGTAAEFVEAVRKASSDANIVVLADLTQVSMPPVALRNVDLGAALRVLQAIRTQSSDQHIDLNILEEQGIGRAGEQPVFTISGDIRNRKSSAAPRDSLVLQVGDVLDEQIKAADMLTAIEAALSMLEPEFPAAQIKFHEATALLIARGHEEQIGCIQLVVQQLRERKTLMEQSLQSQVKKLQLIEAQAEQFSQQNEMLSRNIASMQRDLAAALDRCKVAEGNRDEYARHIKTLEQQLKEAKGG